MISFPSQRMAVGINARTSRSAIMANVNPAWVCQMSFMNGWMLRQTAMRSRREGDSAGGCLRLYPDVGGMDKKPFQLSVLNLSGQSLTPMQRLPAADRIQKRAHAPLHPAGYVVRCLSPAG